MSGRDGNIIETNLWSLNQVQLLYNDSCRSNTSQKKRSETDPQNFNLAM